MQTMRRIERRLFGQLFQYRRKLSLKAEIEMLEMPLLAPHWPAAEEWFEAQLMSADWAGES